MDFLTNAGLLGYWIARVGALFRNASSVEESMLKYERDMGYLFVKNDESEVIFLNDQIKELEAKEVRKRKKIKNVGFERAAAREEYKNWLDVGGANEIATAAMILTNAIEVKNKYEDLRVSAKALEQAQEQE